ncbi:hypothetical protein B0G74_6373 [Paraburkholderia sp. BL9I2N2]|nr:hypothetical protein B0G74_6373 [Paraburkholderia sp. BL9I2N2]
MTSNACSAALVDGTAGFRFCHRLRDVPTRVAAKVAYANRHANIPAVQTRCTIANRRRMPGKRAQRTAILRAFVPLDPRYDCVRNSSARAQCPSSRRDLSLPTSRRRQGESFKPLLASGGGTSRNRAGVSASLRRCCTGEIRDELKAGRATPGPAAVARLSDPPNWRHHDLRPEGTTEVRALLLGRELPFRRRCVSIRPHSSMQVCSMVSVFACW